MTNISLSIGHTPNYATVVVGPITLHYSYSTVIAFSVNADNGDSAVRQNAWGPTTGKHLNMIDGGTRDAKAARIPGDEFERRLYAVIDRISISKRSTRDLRKKVSA